MPTVHNPEAYNEAIYEYYGTLAGKVRRSSYIQRVSAGMKAKKYKGGSAIKARNSSNKLFEAFFKPLEGVCSKS